jgi:hypothetical protein
MPSMDWLIRYTTKDSFFAKSVENRVMRYPEEGGTLLWWLLWELHRGTGGVVL